MCTVSAAEREATVCDVALPVVRAALASAPALTVRLQPEPGTGTRISLVAGDPRDFERRLREAVAEAER